MAARLSLRSKTVTAGTLLVPLFILALCTASPLLAAGATLSLTPPTTTVAPGQAFSLAITLDTGGNATDGTRAVLLFDKNLLTATSVTPGSIYKDYPAAAQTVDNTTGTIKISGLADPTASYSGTGTFATVQFTAKSAGAANVNFDYTPGSTIDSNVADSATTNDILSSATGASVTITGSAVGGGNGDTTKGGTLPTTASLTPTVTLSLIGLGFFAVGFASLFLKRKQV